MTTRALTQSATVWLEFSPSWAFAHYHNNVYFDDVAVVAVQPLFIPFVSKGYAPPPVDLSRAAIRFIPDNIIIKVGTVQTIYLTVDNVENVGVIELTLGYNPDIIEVERLTRGTWFYGGEGYSLYGGGRVYSELYGTQLAGTRGGMLLALQLRGVSAGVTDIAPVSSVACFIGTVGGSRLEEGGLTPRCYGARVRVE